MAILLHTKEDLIEALSEGYYVLQGTVTFYEDKATDKLLFMLCGSPPIESPSLEASIFEDFDKHLTWKLGK